MAFFPVWASGQGAAERLAYKNIRKGKWEKSYRQVQSILVRDSTNIVANYVLAEYFFEPENPDFNIDSAYHFLSITFSGYQKAGFKSRDRLNRLPIDSTLLVKFRQEIDSAAFEQADQQGTEKAYSHFLINFPQASQFQYAIRLRNRAAYKQVLGINTSEAFDEFIKKYPQAEEAADAKKKYELLKFNDLTRDKRLQSFVIYLRDHPDTPYRRLAEQNIFEISTASGTIESYKEFLNNYPESYFTRMAQNILFHLLPEDLIQNHFAEFFKNDSLRSVIRDEHDYVVPFLHEGRFAFMDQYGREVIDTDESDINDRYKCGSINEDVIVLTRKLVAFNGALISNRSAASVDDIGSGFLIIETDGCNRVLHKSGFEAGDGCISSAKVLNGKFLAVQRDNLWSIWTLSGRMLLPYVWDGIVAYKDVIALKTNNRCTLLTAKYLAGLADQALYDPEEFVDEIRPWRNDLVWVKKGEQEGLLNQTLDTVVHGGIQTLQQNYFGSTATDEKGIRIINDAGNESIYLEKIQAKEPWTAVKVAKRWYFLDPKSSLQKGPDYDSIFFSGPFAIGLRKDSIRVHFTPDSFLNFRQPIRVEFVPGLDSSSFLVLERAGKKSLYTRNGRKLFTASYDKIQYAGEGFFMVQKKEKKGLMTSTGKLLLPIEYDAIGTVDRGVVSLLRSMKFGLFHCGRKKLIKTQYDKNLSPYNADVIVAYRDGLYGLVGWDNKPLTKMEFAEVRYWNDSAAFALKDSKWVIYNIKSQQILMDEVRHYKLIQDGEEKLAIVQQGYSYGVIHNKKGTIIPVLFSDIVNVGSRDLPLYFTEKHVEEASIFVVNYYDASGKLLRKEVYEQDDYEKIYCSDN